MAQGVGGIFAIGLAMSLYMSFQIAALTRFARIYNPANESEFFIPSTGKVGVKSLG